MTRMSHERLLHCDYELLAAQPGGPEGAGGFLSIVLKFLSKFLKLLSTISYGEKTSPEVNTLSRTLSVSETSSDSLSGNSSPRP